MMDPNSSEHDELKCPVCYEIPDKEIFLCQNGHTICGQCSASVKICPQCRVSLTLVKVRNRTLEALLDKLKFECPNKELGCKEKVGRKDIKRHLIDCVYSGERIDFCKKIGYRDCGYSTNLRNLKSAIHHYRTSHEVIIIRDRYFPVLLTDFDKAASLKKNATLLSSMWTPVIVDVPDFSLPLPNTPKGGSSSGQNTNVTNSNKKFVLLSSIHGKDKSASWTCVCLSPEPEAVRFHAEFFIKSSSPKVPDLSWRTPTIDATQLDPMLQQAPFRVPLQLLLHHYVNRKKGAGYLKINLRIIRLHEKLKQLIKLADPICVLNRRVEDKEDDAEEVSSSSFSTSAMPGSSSSSRSTM